ncbi:MAG: cupin domain-containing protein [Myxococcota bacterium]
MIASWIDTGEPIAHETLRAEGVHNEVLGLEAAAHQPALDALRRERGYVTQDEVALGPETPQLEAICAKFVDEHAHDDDEVRFVLEGEGVFDVRSRDDRWMRVKVTPGDLIVVPAKRFHRFELTEARSIRCVRLFQEASGWVPHYRAKAAE